MASALQLSAWDFSFTFLPIVSTVVPFFDGTNFKCKRQPNKGITLEACSESKVKGSMLGFSFHYAGQAGGVQADDLTSSPRLYRVQKAAWWSQAIAGESVLFGVRQP